MDGVRRAQAAVAEYYYYSPVYDALIPLRSFASVVRPGVIAAINHPRGSDEAGAAVCCLSPSVEAWSARRGQCVLSVD